MVTEIALALVAVGIGALIQGSIGFGFSLTAVPAMALLRPEAVPVTLLVLALPMTAFMALRERHSIDLDAFLWITGGRLPGTLAGVGLLVALPNDLLTKLLGAFIVAAATMSFLGPSFEARKGTQVVGGLVSGVMSTAAALGGPPLALVNQRSSGPALRSTLALSFLAGVIISLMALVFAGRVDRWHLVLALELLPALLVGLWVSWQAARFLGERWLRPTVLVFAAVAGLLVIILGPSG